MSDSFCGAKVVKNGQTTKFFGQNLPFLFLFCSFSPTDGVFVGYSQSIRGVYICIGYLSVIYRLYIGYVSEQMRREQLATDIFREIFGGIHKFYYLCGQIFC